MATDTTYPGDLVRLDINLYASQLEAEANHLLDLMDAEVMKRMRRGIPEREAVNAVLTELEKGEGFARAWTNTQNRLINSMDNETIARPTIHHAENNPNQKYAWVLGAVKTSHCSDCLRLSKMAPRSAKAWRELGYGLPREGETECSVGCKCNLVKVAGKPEKKPPKEKTRKMDPVKVAAQVQKDILEESKNQYEIGAAIDKNGQILIKKRGTKHQVNFTPAEVERLKGAEIFTHNHPSSGSFSPDDIMACIYHDIKEVRAIAPESHHGRGYYYMRPKFPEGVKTKAEKMQFLQRLDIEAMTLYMVKKVESHKLINSGKGSLNLVNLRQWDEIWSEIAKKHGWEYGFRKE
ncbi:MAG: hypothetical protein K9N34_03630 [Candidatus Marinimicrobia bacterium]|nr:hypothetical protein [Candidatus Neomarinimicrobiota bacterium]MCF7839785.1 hypothetical protein [Candidatus Neomarinimicrobiota bacterium]